LHNAKASFKRSPLPIIKHLRDGLRLTAREHSDSLIAGDRGRLQALLKKASCRLLKKIQRRGARKIDKRRRTYGTLQ
jgi:hypothetical protein